MLAPIFGSLGIAGVRKEIRGVGLTKPAQHPHIFTYITAISVETSESDNRSPLGKAGEKIRADV